MNRVNFQSLGSARFATPTQGEDESYGGSIQRTNGMHNNSVELSLLGIMLFESQNCYIQLHSQSFFFEASEGISKAPASLLYQLE